MFGIAHLFSPLLERIFTRMAGEEPDTEAARKLMLQHTYPTDHQPAGYPRYGDAFSQVVATHE